MHKVRKTIQDSVLATYVTGQLNALFNDGITVSAEMIKALLPLALERLEHCFSKVNNKYFFDGTTAIFNHLHGDQYAMFLYLLSNTAFHLKAEDGLPSKLFLLNKALHGLDAFYEVELPAVFLFVHPLGTVLGRGRYSDYLIVYQRCGVGSNHDAYPSLGPYTTLRPGAAVLGRCQVGRNCSIAAESLLLDRDLPNDTLYIGNPRDFTIRPLASLPSIWRD